MGNSHKMFCAVCGIQLYPVERELAIKYGVNICNSCFKKQLFDRLPKRFTLKDYDGKIL